MFIYRRCHLGDSPGNWESHPCGLQSCQIKVRVGNGKASVGLFCKYVFYTLKTLRSVSTKQAPWHRSTKVFPIDWKPSKLLLQLHSSGEICQKCLNFFVINGLIGLFSSSILFDKKTLSSFFGNFLRQRSFR